MSDERVRIALTLTREVGSKREVIFKESVETEGLPEMRVVHELFLLAHTRLYPDKPATSQPLKP